MVEVPAAGDAGMSGMDHGGEGMMSQADMDDLMAASGAAFDRMFLEQMTEHHRGAVAMAETEIAEGEDAGAVEMATTIAETQAAEIEEMEQILRGL